MPQVVRLDVLLAKTDKALIDPALFNNTVRSAQRAIRHAYTASFHLMPPNRYYLGIPRTKSSIGGFHSKHSVGYQYFYDVSFVASLNPCRVTNVAIRTLEVVRSFLHDSLHRSTFRSFRRPIRIPKNREDAKHSLPQVYREQYGINFRNKDGVAYSDRSLTEKVPHAINLNLLMDGIVIILTNWLLKDVAHEIMNGSTPLEQTILLDLAGDSFAYEEYHHARKFNDSIVFPTRRFLEHWGGERFMKTIVRGMMSGKLAPVKKAFNSQAGGSGQWERVFKKPEFAL